MDQKLDKKGLGPSQIKSVLMVLFYFVLIHVFNECLLSIYGESSPVLNSKVKITDGGVFVGPSLALKFSTYLPTFKIWNVLH